MTLYVNIDHFDWKRHQFLIPFKLHASQFHTHQSSRLCWRNLFLFMIGGWIILIASFEIIYYFYWQGHKSIRIVMMRVNLLMHNFLIPCKLHASQFHTHQSSRSCWRNLFLFMIGGWNILIASFEIIYCFYWQGHKSIKIVMMRVNRLMHNFPKWSDTL